MSESAEDMKEEEHIKGKVKRLVKERKCTEEEVKEWRRVFELFDRDGSHSIDTEEVMFVMIALGAETEMDDETGQKRLSKANTAQVEDMIRRADYNGDGDGERDVGHVGLADTDEHGARRVDREDADLDHLQPECVPRRRALDVRAKRHRAVPERR